MVDFARMLTLDGFIVRKEHVLCTRCMKIEPVHPGDGTPATAFIAGLHRLAEMHKGCTPPTDKAKPKSTES